MAAPVAARRVLFPLYAFNVEVARAPWVTQEAMIAETLADIGLLGTYYAGNAFQAPGLLLRKDAYGDGLRRSTFHTA